MEAQIIMGSTPQDINSQLAVVETKLENISQDVGEIKTVLNSQYVHRIEWEPVRNLVYGMVAAILLGIIGALMAVLLRSPT